MKKLEKIFKKLDKKGQNFIRWGGPGPPPKSIPGVVYTIICTLCEEEGRGMAVYYGQSGKNCYARGKKHLEDFKSGDNSHCMTIHAKVHHPNEQRMMSKFKMIPLRTYRKPLERQIKEALLINNSEVDILLNSGSEWWAGRVPRASVSRPS